MNNIKKKYCYIYIFTNPSYQCVKIGKTKNVDKRLKELDNTSVPTPFEKYATLKVDADKCSTAEQHMHKLLNDKRVRTNREFFNTTAADAYDKLCQIYKLMDNPDNPGIELELKLYMQNISQKTCNRKSVKRNSTSSLRSVIKFNKNKIIKCRLDSTDAYANGEYNSKTGCLTVKKGAHVSVYFKKSGEHVGAETLYNKLKKDGIINKDNIFVKDYEFESPSKASCLLTRSSISGWKIWKC